ncbi:MAG: phosphotransferase enzyme family protein [Phycisphaerae bacterium]
MLNKIKDAFQCFDVPGDFERAVELSCGNINDTWRITAGSGGRQLEYILQRVNTNVFRAPEAMMSNIVRVVQHHREALIISGSSDIEQRVLNVYKTLNGSHYHIDAGGNFWRCHQFIEGTTYEAISAPEYLYGAAFAFGSFLATLDTLPCDMHETIPDFHNGRIRLAQLQEAVSEDRLGRVSAVREEVDFVFERQSVLTEIQQLIDSGRLPLRITHNDTKISNVIFKKGSAEPLCVIDLDTVMGGSALFDFGDLVRSAANTVNEEEGDFAKASFELERFRHIHRGYRDATANILTEKEIEHLADGIKLITLMLVARYLSDYLRGDVYFKTRDPKHNLRRAMNHINLYRSITGQEDAIRSIIQAY